MRQWKWRERDVVDDGELADVREDGRQWMRLINFVIAVRADEQQMMAVWIRDDRLDEMQGRNVGPLQIVEEDDKRMLRLRECGTERLKDPVEPVLVFRGTNGRHGRLRADQELHFRDDVDDNLATRYRAP